jgi:hypothetical protein
MSRACAAKISCNGARKRIWAIAKENRAAFDLSAGVITTKAATTSRCQSASPTTSMTSPPPGF